MQMMTIAYTERARLTPMLARLVPSGRLPRPGSGRTIPASIHLNGPPLSIQERQEARPYAHRLEESSSRIAVASHCKTSPVSGDR